MRRLIIPVSIVVLGASSLAGQSPASPVPSDARSIEAGRRLYRQYCRACHGDDATGDGPLAPRDTRPPDLTDREWKYGGTDGEIFASIRDGIAPAFVMKPMKSRMTSADIWNIVNYLRSLGPNATAPEVSGSDRR